ncbi:peptidoglycan recognition protein family protein [Kineosporia succinea]|uniref:N-acetylmuramoyl-L-alanine amidase n=1 Tax=Kineosporia succinea TaxID=84632 RepID=A0ABT9P054_9ACTN|nr:peptidoglycan recognition family protein [Kineosporia succinea]MDP9826057.1 hypothetical protein [Kineosporia succinea]
MADVSSLSSSRRAFLGLGGALGLGVAGAVTATAVGRSADPVVSSPGSALGCAGGKDSGELAAFRTQTAEGTVEQRIAATRLTASSAPEPTGASRIFGCHYVSRADWGADESLRFLPDGSENWPQTYWPTQTFTVHHTADANADPDPQIRIQNIYRYHAIDQDWGDIGYHFLIDDAGLIYEGRYSGEDSVPGFDTDGQMVNAAHVTGYNAGNVGIALLGDFTAVEPSAKQYRSLVRLLRGLTRWQGVDPQSTVDYVNPISAVAASVAAISSHRDWPGTATECPGDTFHPMLEQLRVDVAG